MTISIENMKTLCDQMMDEDIPPLEHLRAIDNFRTASLTFVPDAIRVMEQLAAALIITEIMNNCELPCSIGPTELGEITSKALAAYNALANTQETVKGDE